MSVESSLECVSSKACPPLVIVLIVTFTPFCNAFVATFFFSRFLLLFTVLRVFVAAVNRVVIEKSGSKNLDFWGISFVIDRCGNIIGKLKSKKEDILICNIDFKKVENARQHWPFLRDRRIDAYKGINM